MSSTTLIDVTEPHHHIRSTEGDVSLRALRLTDNSAALISFTRDSVVFSDMPSKPLMEFLLAARQVIKIPLSWHMGHRGPLHPLGLEWKWVKWNGLCDKSSWFLFVIYLIDFVENRIKHNVVVSSLDLNGHSLCICSSNFIFQQTSGLRSSRGPHSKMGSVSDYSDIKL